MREIRAQNVFSFILFCSIFLSAVNSYIQSDFARTPNFHLRRFRGKALGSTTKFDAPYHLADKVVGKDRGEKIAGLQIPREISDGLKAQLSAFQKIGQQYSENIKEKELRSAADDAPLSISAQQTDKSPAEKVTTIVVSPKADPSTLLGAGVFGSAIAFVTTTEVLAGTGLETPAAIAGGLAAMAISLNDEGLGPILTKVAGSLTYDAMKVTKDFTQTCFTSEPVTKFTRWFGQDGFDLITKSIEKTFEAIDANIWEKEARYQTEKATSYLAMLEKTQQDLKERNAELIVLEKKTLEDSARLTELQSEVEFAKAKQVQMEVRDEKVRAKINKLQTKIGEAKLETQNVVAASEEQIKSLEDKIATAEQESKETYHKFVEVESQLTALPKAEEKIASLTQQLTDTQRQMEAKVAEVDQIEAAKNVEREKMALLLEQERRRSSELEGRLLITQESLSEKSAALHQLQGQLQEVQAEQLQIKQTSVLDEAYQSVETSNVHKKGYAAEESLAMMDFWSGVLFLSAYTSTDPFVGLAFLRKTEILNALRCAYSVLAFKSNDLSTNQEFSEDSVRH